MSHEGKTTFTRVNDLTKPSPQMSWSINAPASTVIKTGWRMFWLGWWGFIRRKDVSVFTDWYGR